MKQNHLGLGIGITLIAYLFFSAASSLVWYFQGVFPTIQIIFIQSSVSFFCILPLALRKGWKRIRTDNLPLHLVRDLFGVGSYYLFFLTLRYLNLVDATTLNYTSPFFVPFVWWIWAKEKFRPHIWWSVIAGFIGVALILNPSKEIFQLGFVFGIFAGLTSSIALVAVRILNLRKEPMSRTLFYYFSISTILTFPFAWAAWVPPTGHQWLLASLIGVSTALGQILLTIAYRYGTASYLSPLGYMMVVYNGFIGYFFLQSPMSWRSIAGTLLIISGGTLTYLLKKRPKSIKESFEAPKQTGNPPL